MNRQLALSVCLLVCLLVRDDNWKSGCCGYDCDCDDDADGGDVDRGGDDGDDNAQIGGRDHDDRDGDEDDVDHDDDDGGDADVDDDGDVDDFGSSGSSLCSVYLVSLAFASPFHECSDLRVAWRFHSRSLVFQGRRN